jgi:hypothetical protein
MQGSHKVMIFDVPAECFEADLGGREAYFRRTPQMLRVVYDAHDPQGCGVFLAPRPYAKRCECGDRSSEERGRSVVRGAGAGGNKASGNTRARKRNRGSQPCRASANDDHPLRQFPHAITWCHSLALFKRSYRTVERVTSLPRLG